MAEKKGDVTEGTEPFDRFRLGHLLLRPVRRRGIDIDELGVLGELIARVLDHLPAPNQQMVRYWGFYSNVARGKRRAAAQRIAAGLDPDDDLSGTGVITVPPVTDDEPYRRRARLSWAALIKKVFEIDPLLCPECSSD